MNLNLEPPQNFRGSKEVPLLDPPIGHQKKDHEKDLNQCAMKKNILLQPTSIVNGNLKA